MKTAMQELIEHFEDFKKHSPNVKLTLDEIINLLKDKLEVEKRQHKTTFYRGINIGALNPELDIEGRKESTKHYYESTFVHLNNQNK